MSKEFILLRPDASAEDYVRLWERMTGKKATPEQVEGARAKAEELAARIAAFKRSRPAES